MFGFGPPTEHTARRQWWRRQIQRQQSSGVPVAEFCRRHGVHPSTFYAWRQRLRESPAPDRPSGQNHKTQARSATNGEPPAFLPVSLREPGHAAQLEIALGNRCIVRVSGNINPQLLRAAIRAAGQLDAHEQGGD